MKQTNKLLTVLLTLLMTVCTGAWAQDVTLDFTTNDWDLPESNVNGLTEEKTFTNSDDYSITLAATTKYYFNSDKTGGYLLLGKKNSWMKFPTFEKPVEKIVITGKAGASAGVEQNIFVGDQAVSTATTGATGVNTYLIDRSAQARGTQYVLQVLSAHNTQITKIEVYYQGSSPVEEGVQPPTISLPAGTYENEQTVELSSTENYDIYYTLDGKEPNDQSGTLYEGPIAIGSDCTLKAIAYDDEGNASEVVSAEYLFTTLKVYIYQRITSLNDVTPNDAFVIGATVDGAVKVAQNVPENKTFAYLSPTNSEEVEGKIQLPSRNHEFFIEIASLTTLSAYMKDSYGRYVYQDETHPNFSVSEAVGDDNAGFSWTIQPNTDGSLKILNIDRQQYIQFSVSHNSYGCYPTAQEDGVLPNIYKFVQEAIIPKPVDETILTTMEEVQEAATAGETEAKVQMDGWYISGVSGKNFYLTDGQGFGILGYEDGHGFAQGDKLSGTVTVGLAMFRQAPEMTGLTATSMGLTVVNEQEVPVLDKTLAEIALPQYAALVFIPQLTYNAADGLFYDESGASITPYDTFKTGYELESGSVYDVTGVVVYFNSTREIAPLSIDGFAPAEEMALIEIGNSKWATFVSSIEAPLPEGVKAYTADNVSPTGLIGMSLIADQGECVPANTPVLLYSDIPVREEVIGRKYAPIAETRNGLLVGVQGGSKAAPVGSWVLQDLDEGVGFYQVADAETVEIYVPSGKAYLEYDLLDMADVKMFRLNNTTAIAEVEAEVGQKAAIFDLSGRRVTQMQKGIYIVNGKKVINK